MTLPTPYYEHDGITIYHGDSHILMPYLQFDAILSDPPYGVGKYYGALSSDTLETFRWSVTLIVEQQKPSAIFCPQVRLLDLPVRPEWIGIWNKPYGTLGLIAYPIYPHWEAICFYGIKGNYAGNQNHRSDVFTANSAKAKESGHPTPKPIPLFHQLLTFTPFIERTILDPFMGSGTTLRAAKDLRRKAIGIEIEEKYCEIAAKRLSQEVLDF